MSIACEEPPETTSVLAGPWPSAARTFAWHSPRAALSLAGMADPPPQRTLLSVEEASRQMGVVPNTVRNWIKAGELTDVGDGTKIQIDVEQLRVARLLREVDLLGLSHVQDAGATAVDVTEAIVQGIIERTPRRRFSLLDADRLCAWMHRRAGECEARFDPATANSEESPQQPGVSLEEWATDCSGRFEALKEYMLSSRDPGRLPPTFFDVRVMPDFIPPVGVFRAWYGSSMTIDEEGLPARSVTMIGRCAVWVAHGNKLIRMPATDGFRLVSPGGLPPGETPPEHAEANLRYAELARVWRDLFRRRRGELRARGISIVTLPDAFSFEGRSRRDAIHRYHREHLSPSDLPDWYFATEECPPFEPPTGVFRYEYGAQAVDPVALVPRYAERPAGE